MTIDSQMPEDTPSFEMPATVHARLQFLLNQQDQGLGLTAIERAEAEALVDLAESLSLLKLREDRRDISEVDP